MDASRSASGAVDFRLYDSSRATYYDKPRLRGWLHLISFECALVLGTLLIATAQGFAQTAVATVYATVVAGLFGTSALYHRGRWGPTATARLQRLDHLMILLLIAGTATVPMQVCLPGVWKAVGLTALWTLTGVAIGVRLMWMNAPERVAGAIYLGLGWVAGAAIPAVWTHSGVAPALLLVGGGLLYTVGALAYYYRKPDPRPAVFGYHEVFHLFVTLAAAAQYVAIAVFLL
jgi:hemolysin III